MPHETSENKHLDKRDMYSACKGLEQLQAIRRQTEDGSKPKVSVFVKKSATNESKMYVLQPSTDVDRERTQTVTKLNSFKLVWNEFIQTKPESALMTTDIVIAPIHQEQLYGVLPEFPGIFSRSSSQSTKSSKSPREHWVLLVLNYKISPKNGRAKGSWELTLLDPSITIRAMQYDLEPFKEHLRVTDELFKQINLKRTSLDIQAVADDTQSGYWVFYCIKELLGQSQFSLESLYTTVSDAQFNFSKTAKSEYDKACRRYKEIHSNRTKTTHLKHGDDAVAPASAVIPASYANDDNPKFELEPEKQAIRLTVTEDNNVVSFIKTSDDQRLEQQPDNKETDKSDSVLEDTYNFNTVDHCNVHEDSGRILPPVIENIANEDLESATSESGSVSGDSRDGTKSEHSQRDTTQIPIESPRRASCYLSLYAGLILGGGALAAVGVLCLLYAPAFVPEIASEILILAGGLGFFAGVGAGLSQSCCPASQINFSM